MLPLCIGSYSTRSVSLAWSWVWPGASCLQLDLLLSNCRTFIPRVRRPPVRSMTLFGRKGRHALSGEDSPATAVGGMLTAMDVNSPGGAMRVNHSKLRSSPFHKSRKRGFTSRRSTRAASGASGASSSSPCRGRPLGGTARIRTGTSFDPRARRRRRRPRSPA